eukprot:CAMPEP_0179306796 /NCGR_PEP_ID=MMETSP0797-20121207/50314_1 /TAXON_ID=47934 /ORGANISM="Dinophysis acuminata, Strain DAEP01" /LENGTH=119 /DNA_ID=CAMNT_0021016467 /DNA_START=70 /DNA_END=430 /DNA_ORIENTATION=+
MSCTGTLKKFMEGKGFGFIENSDGSGDVFVHFSQLTSGSSEDLAAAVGSELTFDIAQDERSGKTKASNVTIKGGSVGGWGGGKSGGKAKAIETRTASATEKEAARGPATSRTECGSSAA